MHAIFVSSTYVDLQLERIAVRDAILRLEHLYSGMEYFGSDPERPLETSLAFLRNSTIYIGIIAYRYGTIDATTGKSVTQREYEEARRLGIPTLIYLKDPSCVIHPTSTYLDFDSERREKLTAFKELLQVESTVQAFTTPEDLAAKVTADLARLLISEAASHKKQLEGAGPERDNLRVDFVPMLGARAVGKTVFGCMLYHRFSDVLRATDLELKVDFSDYSISNYRGLENGYWAPCWRAYENACF